MDLWLAGRCLGERGGERGGAASPEEERGDLIAAYARRLNSPDREERLAAARSWSRAPSSSTTSVS